jgi:hypothetical protein
MRGYILRKLLLLLIIIVPVLSGTDCKKQAKCGCDGDVLFTLTKAQALVYFSEDGTTITFQTLSDSYSSYNICNPGEMFPGLSESKSGDILLVSGSVYWDCTYLYQSSNSSYQNPYKVYSVQGTEIMSDLYGKK